MKFSRILIILLPFFVLANCDKPEILQNNDPDFEVENIDPTGSEKYLTLKSSYIFDQEKLHTFELNIPGPALAQIDADPTAEEYVEGTLTFEGETVSPVGIRYKGSVGAFVGCTSGPDWSNPSGYKTCTKLSMKIKINWQGSDTKFYGLKKLQFHSMNLDPSQMRERLGYWLYREMGVPAPRSVHARLIINGKFSGIYALTEQIDGRFTRYHFEKGKGNLYKEIWPVNSLGQPYREQEYLKHLETNEDENPSAAIIRGFGEQIAASDPVSIRSLIINRMDLAEIISYAVVDRAIRNDDGAFHWYCGGNSCSNHNYYWYENPDGNTLHLIPWDLDNAFENIQYEENPVTPIADDWGETRNNCAPFPYGDFQGRQRSAACDKLTAGWASFAAEYDQKLAEFKNGPFAAAQVNALLDTWETQIRSATIEAEQAHGDALSGAKWEGALTSLKNKLEFARNN